MVFALPGRFARPLVCFCILGFALAAPLARAADTEPLPLTEALKMGEKFSPRLAAQGAALAAATELVPRARELPDPKLRIGVDNLPVNGADRFRYDTDFMTMRKIGLMQDFPNGEKRRLRGERAALERDVEAANLAAQRAGLRREIALAWLELYFAQQARAPLVELVGELQLQLDTVSAAIAAGRQNTADALALRGAGVAAQDRVIEQDRTIERARYALAAWLRDDASRPLADPPDTGRFDHPPTALLDNLHEHPEQRVYAEREALARTDVALATNSKKSDWSLEVAYGQRGPAFSNMISVMVSIDLPWEAGKRQEFTRPSGTASTPPGRPRVCAPSASKSCCCRSRASGSPQRSQSTAAGAASWVRCSKRGARRPRRGWGSCRRSSTGRAPGRN